MNERYVILRALTPQGGPGFDSQGPVEVDLALESLSSAAAADLAETAGYAAAPVMPLTLIKPIAAAEPTPGECNGSTWGIEAVGATASSYSGKGITVAVLDTGIDADHSAFDGVHIVERDFVNGGPGDPDGHGTHVAGTIVGRDVDGCRIGVARGVTELLACKVLGGSARGTDAIVEAIWWATRVGKAHIISMSLGIDFPGYVAQRIEDGLSPQAATSRALTAYGENLRFLDRLAGLVSPRKSPGHGALLLAASGNESHRTGPNGGYTIDASWPASGEQFIAVGAVDRDGAGGFPVASFSNTGPRLSGPGVGVRSAWPGGGLMDLDGTSMATPHAAGVAALWAEKELASNPGVPLDLGAVEATLIANALPIAGSQRRDVGRGLVRAPL